MITQIEKLLGNKAENLLGHQCKTISKDKLHLPVPTRRTASSLPTTATSAS
jgi:hypothetical protein